MKRTLQFPKLRKIRIKKGVDIKNLLQKYQMDFQTLAEQKIWIDSIKSPKEISHTILLSMESDLQNYMPKGEKISAFDVDFLDLYRDFVNYCLLRIREKIQALRAEI